MALKKVELVRQRILRGMQRELVGLRSFISSAGENEEAVEILRGDSGTAVLGVMTDTLMRELGHVPKITRGDETEADSSSSMTRRALGKQRRVT